MVDEQIVEAVDRYLDGLFAQEDPVLKRALDRSDAAGLPKIQISPSQGKLLYLLARLIGAERVLELGTLGGYSTIWLARALPEAGRLLTLEYEPRHAEVAQRNLEHAGLADRVEIVVGAAVDSLGVLADRGGPAFDLVFIDADKESYPAYLDLVVPMTRRGGLILADNVIRGGRVLDPPGGDTQAEAVRRFNAQLAADKRLESVVLHLTGIKGHDGIAVVRVI